MRKILLSLTVLLLVFTLSACTNSEDKALSHIHAVAESFTFDSLDANRLTLPTSKDNVAIQWRSQDTLVLSHEGHMNRPLNQRGDLTVDLLATMRYEGLTYETLYTVNVPALDAFSVSESRSIEFESLAEEYIVSNSTIDIYYMNNRALPYVDIEAFLHLIKGAIVTDELDLSFDEDLVSIAYTVEYDEALYDDLFVDLILDFTKDTVTFNRYDFFTSIAESTQTDFGQGLDTIDFTEEVFGPVTLNLGDYRFDLVQDNDQYLIPLHLANLFFTGSMYDVYYNHDKIYGVDTYQVLDDPNILSQIRNSSLIGEDISDDLKWDTYNYLVFTFNYFYGLKEDQNVTDFNTTFRNHVGGLLGNTTRHYETVQRMAFGRDDLHTSYLMSGYYSTEQSVPLELGHLGARTINYVNAQQTLGSFCARSEGLTLIDDSTAVITIKSFNEDTPGMVNEAFTLLEDETVDNVILDLACNGGGIMGTMMQVLGHLTDEDLAYHSFNALDRSTSSVWFTSDIEAKDYEFYILTSPLTYSAANAMASMARDMNIATLIGQDSQGGAASITTNITPSGAVIIMSSANILANSQYESIEMGIAVERIIPLSAYANWETFLDHFYE